MYLHLVSWYNNLPSYINLMQVTSSEDQEGITSYMYISGSSLVIYSWHFMKSSGKILQNCKYVAVHFIASYKSYLNNDLFDSIQMSFMYV